ncbi:hypothetical protein [Micromonospora sp. NPDC049274]|uniref:hypothetical protein n=1 Tax=Micromonospora sp. NPDC049274 TaxID=3154829 RepID=UPI00344751E0
MAGSVGPYDTRARTLGTLGDREPRDRLDQSAELPMRLVAGVAVYPVGGGRLLKEGGQQETGTDGSRDQHHSPGEPAQSAGHERSRSVWRRHRRGSVDGTSHADTTPLPSGLLTHSSHALTHSHLVIRVSRQPDSAPRPRDLGGAIRGSGRVGENASPLVRR